MSWQKAKEEAQRLVDRMQFRNSEIEGKEVSIEPIVAKCPHEGEFRVMIEQAVGRILRARGAIVPPVKRD